MLRIAQVLGFAVLRTQSPSCLSEWDLALVRRGDATMRLTNNISDHKAVVLTANKFEDTEVLVPVFRLLEEGWHVDIAAPTLE